MSDSSDNPLIVEAALNGATPASRNPKVPRTPAEIAADALACLRAGAAVIHTHIPDIRTTGDTAAAEYVEGWRPVLAQRADAILYSTVAFGNTFEERFGHYRPLARAGMRMGALDPGSVNLASHGDDGLPGELSFVYENSFTDIAGVVALLREQRLAPSIAIYEPGFLRAVLAYERAGKLPQGAFVKFYFGGTYNLVDGKRSNVTFGLPPTKKALDAYLEMMEGSQLPWAVAVLGGCVVESGMAQLALERSGHVRVGLEDYAGERRPANVDLVAEVVALAKRSGRPIASPREAAKVLNLAHS